MSRTYEQTTIVRLASRMVGGSLEDALVGIWGLTTVDDVAGVPSVEVLAAIRDLLDQGALILAYDPAAEVALERVVMTTDAYEATRGVHLLLVFSSADEFVTADLTKVREIMRMPTIVDARDLAAPVVVNDIGSSASAGLDPRLDAPFVNDTPSAGVGSISEPKHRGRHPKIVHTLSPVDLARAADDLVLMVERSGFVPDGVVGIETGGLKVVAALTTPPAVVLRCRMTRPTTALKRLGLGRRLLRRLPYAVANLFRRIEDRLGSRKEPRIPPPTNELVRGLDEISRIVAERRLTRLLVVDDAVDSGRTLGCVMTALRARLPEDVRVMSAVITRTRLPERTAMEPDFALHSMVLCRFPWSFDYKVQR